MVGHLVLRCCLLGQERVREQFLRHCRCWELGWMGLAGKVELAPEAHVPSLDPSSQPLICRRTRLEQLRLRLAAP